LWSGFRVRVKYAEGKCPGANVLDSVGSAGSGLGRSAAVIEAEKLTDCGGGGGTCDYD